MLLRRLSVLLLGLLVVAATALSGQPHAVARSATASAGGSTFYVAPGGRDSNSGSSARPLATIQRALRGARAGDTIIVRSGSYAPASFVRGGVKGAPIRLRAQGSVTLTGNDSGVGLRVDGVSYVRVRGFKITNFDVGIEVSHASDVVVRGNTLRSNTSTGIETWKAVRVKVLQNTLIDRGASYPAPAVQDYGVSFFFSRRVVAKANHFFGKHNQALSFKRRTRYGEASWNVFNGCLYVCIYVGQNDDDPSGDMTSSRITVRYNRFRDWTDPISGSYYRVSQPIAVRNVNSALVEYNLIDRSALSRITVIPSPQLSGLEAGNNTIRHNVVRDL